LFGPRAKMKLTPIFFFVVLLEVLRVSCLLLFMIC
jgi:hypothetical protein